MKRHLDINIAGKVQGILFRHNTLLEARKYSITGFVRNNQDETVYIEAEGEGQALDKFLDWCGKGPVGATVTKVSVKRGSLKDFSDFNIQVDN